MDTTEEQITAMQQRLKDLDRKMQKTIIKKGLRVGAKVIQNAAKAEAPVESGLTKRSIKVRAGRTGDGFTRINVGMNAKDYSGKAFYSAFLMYGHKQGNRKLGDARKEIPANPFLQRAFDATKDKALQAAVDSWREQIEAESTT